MHSLSTKILTIGSILVLSFSITQSPSFANGSSTEQWAVSGEASTSYSRFEPVYATGAPDTAECDDNEAAWASLKADTVEWLAMNFTTPVYPEAVNIYQNNIKNSITKVEVSADGNEWFQVYTGDAANWSWGACDEANTSVFYDILSITDPITDWPAVAVNRVKITVDQTSHGEWAEIDAVQLVGSTTPPTASARASATKYPYVTGKAVSTKTGSNKLTANKGTWIGTPAPTFAYQWFSCSAAVTKVKTSVPRSCKAIAGAKFSTLKVVSNLKGKFIAVKVTGTSQGTAPNSYLSKSTPKVK
jgi:hypothetical protein